MAATPVVVPLGPAAVNITGVRAGDRNLITLTLTNQGTPINLTGQTLTSQVRKAVTDVEAAIDADVAVIDASGGVASIRWPGDDVRTLLAGAAAWAGVWDVQVDPGGGADPLTVAAGTWAAEMDVTR